MASAGKTRIELDLVAPVVLQALDQRPGAELVVHIPEPGVLSAALDDLERRALQSYLCVDRRHCLGVTPSRRRIVVER